MSHSRRKSHRVASKEAEAIAAAIQEEEKDQMFCKIRMILMLILIFTNGILIGIKLANRE